MDTVGEAHPHAPLANPSPILVLTLSPLLYTGHLYSTDLRTWYFGENVYGHTGAAREQCSLTIDAQNGSAEQVQLSARQRPTIFRDGPSGPQYLFNGASSSGTTMYYHSFTMVQQIRA